MRAKDFSELAAILKDARLAALASTPPETHPQLSRVFDSLCRSAARVAARQSSRFNLARFLSACGLTP